MLTDEMKERIGAAWKEHQSLLLFIARWKCGNNVHEGKELLQKSILAVISGTHAWDHEKYSFVTHMRYVMFDLHKADSRLVEKTLVERLTEKTADVAAPGIDPEEELRGKRMFHTLIAACPDDSDERKLAECSARGIHDIKEQAEALGIDVDRVYRGRERLKAIVDGLLKRMNLKLVKP